ncbi:ras-related protein Rab-44 isoform X2 [Motacilla alba alba]|uniref:ras-related protein Rab-44 isoform X2 n=1 Tax=Motacilla alba alba TaxID=1094192 RepID=UPI0018D5388D|nr:ras-related protein Rab-44 isoform X2 [Motacilla alba alba]
MEAPSSTNVELVTEVEADLQVWNEDGSPGTQRGGGVAPGVQLEKDNPEAGLGEELGAAAVHSEGPSPAGTPVGSPDLCGLFPGTSQALVEAQLQLSGGLSPENAQGGKGERAVQLQENEEEDGAQGQGEHGLPHQPVPHPSAVTLGQGEGAGAWLQPGENDESLDTVEDQSSGANVQLIAEGDELRLTPGGSTEADLQPWGEAGSSGTEQGGRLDPEVQPLDQVNTEDILEMEVEDVQEDVMELLAEVEADVQVWNEAGPSGTEHGGSVDSEVHPLDEGNKAELVEGEAEDAQADLQLSEGLSSGVPREGETGTNAQMEEKDNGAQGQGEYELPHEPVLDLHGSGVRQGEGAGEDMQAQEEAESLDTVEDQSSDANVQLIAEGDELRLTPGGSTEADLQPWGEAGCSGTEQGGRLDPDVQPLNQGDKAELVEEEAEDAQTLQLSEARSSGVPWGGEIETNAQMEEEEDGAQRQGEYELPHEPELDLHGSGVRQGEGAGEDMQAQEEAESLHTTEAQSSGANVQLIAEGGELKSASGESTEADLQPLIQTDSMATEQGGSVDPEVQPLDQGEEAEVVERKAEHSWTDTQLCVTASPETPQGGEHCAALQPRDGDGDWGQGQGGRGQMQELVPDPSGVTIRQRRGTEAGVQPMEEAESLDTVEDQSSDANVQLIAEGGELRLTPGGSTEADLQPWGEAGCSGTDQGGSVDPEVHSLDQEEKEDILERKAEDAQEDMMFHEGPSPGGPWRGEGERAVQLEEEEEEEEDGAQGQGEGELPHEPVLDLHGSGVRQGEGAGEDMQAQEEAESLHTTEAQSSGANVQLIAEGDELRLTPGGSTEADLQPWGEAGCSGTEQGGRLDPEVQPLDQVNTEDIVEIEVEDVQEDVMELLAEVEADVQVWNEAGPSGTEHGGSVDSEVHPLDEGNKAELVEGEAEDAQADLQLSEGLSSGVPREGETGTNAQMEEKDNEAQGQDVWRLCAPGQAAQRELQEQVSAQGHEGRLHTVAQHPEGETPPARELENTAAGPAEHPKQEVPPASMLHKAVPPGDAGSDQLGGVLRENSLGQRQLLGEQSKDLSVGQREKMQEFGQKMSQEGEPSSGEPGAVTAGAAPQGCPKAALDPDHLYNVLFVGDSHVGKTSFLYRLHADTFNPHLTATVGLDYQIKNLVVDNKRFALRLWDSAGQERIARHS